MKVVDKLENKRKVKENGITLIALVITIIVLLILAAVSIATLTGENGILTRANEAKTETEEAKEDELRRLTAIEAATNLENTTHTDNSTGEEKTVTIPAGFAVSQVEGENTIEDGLVIIDSKGNEFVWVPVNDDYFKKYIGYDDGILSTTYTEENCEEPYTDGYATEQDEYNSMKTSVLKYNGFYVGRYEAGIESKTKRVKDSGIEDAVVIKSGKNVYNYIGWSNSNDMTVESGGAVQKSKEFAKENGYTSVTSTLIYGIQSDVGTLKWKNIEKSSKA